MFIVVLFHPTFEQQYELAKSIGDKRFGSPCEHKEVKNGHCTQCQRKVIVKKSQAR